MGLASLSSKSVEEGRLGLLDINLGGRFCQLVVNWFSSLSREAGDVKGRRSAITSSGNEAGKKVDRLIVEVWN